MSLIPFILDLADELNEFNRCLTTGVGSGVGAMDIDDFGFGIYPHELQQQLQMQHQQPQQLRRASPRTSAVSSQLYWLPSLSNKQRHHPYYRSKACCNKAAASQLHSDHEKEPGPTNLAGSGGDRETAKEANTATGTKSTAAVYSVLNKNGGFQVSMNVKQFAPNELTVKTIDNCIVVEGQHEDKEDGHGVISRHFIRKYMLPKGYDPNEVLSTLSSDGILTVKAPPPPATKTDEPLERIVDIQQTGPAHSSVKDASKEQQQQQPQQAKAATATQQQQQQQQKQEDLQKLPERNGEANSNDILAEPETEVEQPAVVEAAATAASSSSLSYKAEEAMLISNVAVNPAAVDFTTADTAVAVTTAAEEDANANITNNTNNINNDNGITDDENPTTIIPVTKAASAATAIAIIPNEDINAIVVVEMDTIPEGADVGVAVGVVQPENEADGMDGISVGGVGVGGVVVDDEQAGIENLVVVGAANVVAAQPPTAADLVAAADAAILLAKTTQCGENGNKSANEEIAN